MQINLILADDEELFREGMSHILSRDPMIEVQYKASNGAQLISYLTSATQLPDIVLMDIKMPEMNGVEATKVVRDTFPEIGIVALTTYNTKPFIRNMIDVGASAYLVKNAPKHKVVHTIKQVYFNGFYYDTEVMSALKNLQILDKSERQTGFDSTFLTERESEVLLGICEQKTSQEIGEKLYISKRTVEVHRKNLLEKTQSKNIAGLVIFAIQNGLVSIEDIE